jgi:hypothetical protein
MVKLVRATDGMDVPSGSVSLAMSDGRAGEFKYGPLANAVTLAAHTAYYLVSQETNGGDQWYDFNTRLRTTAAGSCDAAVVSGNGDTWTLAAGPNQSFGPVDFTYETPSLMIGGLTNGRFQLTFLGQPGDNYVLEASDDLRSWMPRSTISLPEAGSGLWTELIPLTGSAGFFRARVK